MKLFLLLLLSLLICLTSSYPSLSLQETVTDLPAAHYKTVTEVINEIWSNYKERHPESKLGGTNELVFMDYVMSALDGFNGDYYVPGSYNCTNNTRYFQIDVLRTYTKYTSASLLDVDDYEDVVFNTTSSISGYLPDAIYYCFFVPKTAKQVWTAHYKTFQSLQDFEAGFIQNIMGNFLSFIDIYDRIYTAAEGPDYQVVVYQLARLVRRMIVFDSMMRESLIKDALKLGAYVNYYSTLGDETGENKLLYQSSNNWTSPNDTVSIIISAMTGFFDGSFRATNTSACRTSLNLMTRSFANTTVA